MKRIIVEIYPFDFKQRFYIFEGDILKMQATVPLADLPDQVLSLAHQNEITDIEIKGGINFTAKIKEEIRAKEVSQYGASTLQINLIA